MARRSQKSTHDIPRMFDVTVKLKQTVGDPVRVVRTQDISLLDLHEVIQTSFAWCGGHLWTFETKQRQFFGPIGDGLDDDWDDAESVAITSFFDRGVKKLTYTYDFGDCWEHSVSIREIARSAAKAEDPNALPRCVRASGAAPPEDCGGPWGYQDLVDSAMRPAGEDQEADESLAYYGITRPYDVEKCDIDTINGCLRQFFAGSIRTDDSGDQGEIGQGEVGQHEIGHGEGDGEELSLCTFVVKAGDRGYVITSAAFPELPASEEGPSQHEATHEETTTEETNTSTITQKERAIVARFCQVTDDCFDRLEDDDYDAEFFGNCRAVLTHALELGLDLFSGKPEGWAAAAVNVVAGVNMMQAPYKNWSGSYLTNDEIAKSCGVSQATMTSRAKQLRDALEVTGPGDFRYLVESQPAKNFQLACSAARSLATTMNLSSESALDIVSNLETLRDMLDGRELISIVEMPIEQARETMECLQRGENLDLVALGAGLLPNDAPRLMKG